MEAVNLTLFPQLVDWPDSPQEINGIMNEFYRTASIPSVIGCVDGTHIYLDYIKKDIEAQFVNQFHSHLINAMFVSGPKLR